MKQSPNQTTPVTLPSFKGSLNYRSVFVCIGSCFAEEIGARFKRLCFDAISNPIGTLFNPLALARALELCMDSTRFDAQSFFLHQELWRHFLVHSELASTDLDTSVASANERLSLLSEYIDRCDCLIVTLGTAWIYKLKTDPTEAIGHNHKLPRDRFSKRLLTPEEIASALQPAFARLHELRPDLIVVVSVSPVKHLREGLRDNNLSKAVLLLASMQLEESHPNVYYFPAFEILQDELRDYRFYKSDMAHPSRAAVDYISHRFLETILDEESKRTVAEIEAVLTALRHSPSHPDTKAYSDFKLNLKTRIHALADKGIDSATLEQRFLKLP